jgi:hypothetical protein
MSVVARKFTANPLRTGSETWEVILNTITNGADSAKQALTEITGIAASIIADKTPANNPITIVGRGSRLRIYCLYDEDALNDESNESKLSWQLFENDNWEIHFPVQEEDYKWVTDLLVKKGKRFKTYMAGNKPLIEETVDESKNELSINIEKFK